MANRNFANSRMYTGHVMPVFLDCNFVVAPDDAGGLGITSLKGPYVQNVFMHTSQTPGAGNANPTTPGISVVNPNPASGTIVVQLQDNYNKIYLAGYDIIAPASGSDVKIDNSAMTAGVAYTITTLGNATSTKWHAIGVPAGITPAVGVSFIAASNGGAGNTLTSRVQTSAAAGSGLISIESMGDPNLLIAPDSSQGQGYGAQIILQCRALAIAMGAYTPSGTISAGVIAVAAGTAGDAVTNNAGVLNSTGGQDLSVDAQTFTGAAASLTGTASPSIAAPAVGSIIRLRFMLSNSSVQIQNE